MKKILFLFVIVFIIACHIPTSFILNSTNEVELTLVKIGPNYFVYAKNITNSIIVINYEINSLSSSTMLLLPEYSAMILKTFENDYFYTINILSIDIYIP